MLYKLISLANKLDKLGLYKEADLLDTILRKEADKNSLIRALKKDDTVAAKQALVGLSGEDLGLTHKEFQRLTNMIFDAQEYTYDTRPMEEARLLLGIGKDIKTDKGKIDTSEINPFTMKPWPSGPVVKNELDDILGIVNYVVSKHGGIENYSIDESEDIGKHTFDWLLKIVLNSPVVDDVIDDIRKKRSFTFAPMGMVSSFAAPGIKDGKIVIDSGATSRMLIMEITIPSDQEIYEVRKPLLKHFPGTGP